MLHRMLVELVHIYRSLSELDLIQFLLPDLLLFLYLFLEAFLEHLVERFLVLLLLLYLEPDCLELLFLLLFFELELLEALFNALSALLSRLYPRLFLQLPPLLILPLLLLYQLFGPIMRRQQLFPALTILVL